MRPSDGQAASAARALNAQAFTRGRDVFFGGGRYQPDTSLGRKLLAHELTHTIQQTGRRPFTPPPSLAAGSNVMNSRSGNPQAAKSAQRKESAEVSRVMSPPPISRVPSGAQPTVFRQAGTAPAGVLELGPQRITETHEELIQWIVDRLRRDPEDNSGEVSERLQDLSPMARAQVMTKVQELLPPGQLARLTGAEAAAEPLVVGTAPEPIPEPVIAIEVPAGPKTAAPTPAAPSGAPSVGTSVSGAGETTVTSIEHMQGETTEAAPPPAEAAALAELTPEPEVPLEPKAVAEKEPPVSAGPEPLPKEEAPTPPPPAEAKPTEEAERAPAEMPDVSKSDPMGALSAVGSLPPVQLVKGLQGVSAAVSHSVANQKTELAENPPQMERPSGVPTTKVRRPEGAPPEKVAEKVAKTPEGKDVPTQPPAVLPPPPTLAVTRARRPEIRSDEKGQVSPADAQKFQASIARLPVFDSASRLTEEKVPQLNLEGNSDPKRIQEQSGKFTEGVSAARSEGRRDVAAPMGEDNIFPDVPKETLRAQLPKGGGKTEAGGKPEGSASPAATAAPSAGDEGAAPEQALSIIAQEKKGSEIQAAVAGAKEAMAAQRQQQIDSFEKEKQRSREEIDGLISQSSAEQTAVRGKAQEESRQLRGQWSQGQQSLVADANSKAGQAIEHAGGEINRERSQAQRQAAQHIAKGNQEAAQARRDAEQKAAKARQRGKEESKGVWGWLASKAKAFFDRIKSEIKAAFEFARRVVREAIEKAKRFAVDIIEKGRKAIVGIIRGVGNALIAIGDKVLAGFPALRTRFRNAIKDKIDKAEAIVNKLADKLKEDVQKALDTLGAGLDKALGLMEKGMLAAVDVANTVVQGAIKVAKAVADAIGKFVALVADVAADPIGWLKNLGAAVVDGIRNHLWSAFQRAVSEWFNQKLEQVLGLGAAIWNLLKQGGISIAEVGRMAWEGLKAAIPRALVEILVEKLVAMLVPAAGAVMVIIDALRAAWGAIKRILAAFAKFFAFLKSVKEGGVQAAKKFAEALAAAAIAVIDFVANWLLLKLAKAASGIASRVKQIAQRIGTKLKRGFRKVKAFVSKRKRGKPTAETKRKSEEAKTRRLDKGIDAAVRYVNKYSGQRVAKTALKLRLFALKLRYRLTKLIVVREGENWTVLGEINPKKKKATSAKPPKNRFNAVRRKDGTIEGKWADFVWQGYPAHVVTPHPANKKYGHKNGTRVPRPRGGKYVVGKKFERTTPGAKYTTVWRQYLYDQRDTIKASLRKQNPSWSKSQVDRTGKRQVEAQYGGMAWLDLDLRGWEAHHIRPVSYWNGSDADSNFQYLKENPNEQNPKTNEHSPFKKWWDAREKDIEREVK